MVVLLTLVAVRNGVPRALDCGVPAVVRLFWRAAGADFDFGFSSSSSSSLSLSDSDSDSSDSLLSLDTSLGGIRLDAGTIGFATDGRAASLGGGSAAGFVGVSETASLDSSSDSSEVSASSVLVFAAVVSSSSSDELSSTGVGGFSTGAGGGPSNQNKRSSLIFLLND